MNDKSNYEKMLAKVKEAIYAQDMQPVSIHLPISIDSELLDVIEDTSPTVEDKLIQEDNVNTVNDYVKRLPPRERAIISHKFGIIGGEPKTLQQVADLYNITRERVRQVEKKALARLKKYMERDNIHSINDIF